MLHHLKCSSGLYFYSQQASRDGPIGAELRFAPPCFASVGLVELTALFFGLPPPSSVSKSSRVRGSVFFQTNTSIDTAGKATNAAQHNQQENSGRRQLCAS
ncbi:hypothetical protein OUZ56_005074 [Daphnia magna]|uniref:Uncharacterized protein n=1 Tax=Daphnia magna TaxID=35525 RepID=A0ABQ9YRQ8_9CRUS|nr:hypothetical protein OUZ56_005074 [Daphnia magna]